MLADTIRERKHQMKEKLNLLRFMVNTIRYKRQIKLIAVLIAEILIVSGNVLFTTISLIG